MRAAITVGDVDHAPAVRRPDHLGFQRRRVGESSRVTRIFNGRREDITARGECDFLSVRREREIVEAIRDPAMLHRRRARRSSARHRDLGRRSARGVEPPDPEIPLENDGAAVIRDRRPQHSTTFEIRDLLRGRRRPDVLRTAAIGDVEDLFSVRPPHRPYLLRPILGHRLVAAVSKDPDLSGVDVAVTVAPPLRRRDAARDICERLPVGRRRRKVFVDVSLRGDLHRCAAVR